MIDSLHRDIVFITKQGSHDARIISDNQMGCVFETMLTVYMHMCIEIRITPKVDYNNIKMALEARKAGYDWAKAKKVLERD